MPALRYLALAALVVWLGLTIGALDDELGSNVLGGFALLAPACGMVVLTALLVMKFVGPPPRSFTLRAAVAFLMFVSTVYAASVPAHARWALAVTTVLGLILLFWYSRE